MVKKAKLNQAPLQAGLFQTPQSEAVAPPLQEESWDEAKQTTFDFHEAYQAEKSYVVTSEKFEAEWQAKEAMWAKATGDHNQIVNLSELQFNSLLQQEFFARRKKKGGGRRKKQIYSVLKPE